jgi:parvulin-like peptidyl-prolyl isomerase
MTKWRVVLVAVLVPLGLRGAEPPDKGRGVLVNAVVAIVNNVPVTKLQVDERVPEFLRDPTAATADQIQAAWDKAREIVIDERLLIEEARRRQVEVAPEDVNAEIQRLKDMGVNVEGRRDLIRERLMMFRMLAMLRSARTITPEEVTAYYESHSDEFVLRERRRLLLLAVYASQLKPDQGGGTKAEAKQLADDLLARLKNGEDFAALAKKHSHGPNADKGGDQGWIKKGSWVEALDEAAFKLQPGQTSDPLETQDGYIILKLAEVQPASRQSLAEARPAILERLQRRYVQEQRKQLLERLRQTASIIRLDLQPKAEKKQP